MPKAGVKKLRNLRVGEISVVPDGANEDAEILLRKAKDGGFTPCEDCPDTAMCAAKGKCAIETPAKGAGKGEKSAVKKGLEIARAATEAFIEKAGDAAPDPGMVGLDVAAAALDEGIEKAAQTFEELIGAREQAEKLRVGVGALNQSVWSILDDPENARSAPALIAKSVMQFSEWLAQEFDLSVVAKGADDDEADETADETAEDTVAGGSGDEAGETGIGKSGDEAMPNDVDSFLAEHEEMVAKAKALEDENNVLKARMAKLEEAEAERIIEKAAADVARSANGLVLPTDKLRVIVKQLDADGCKALGDVLQAAGKQAAAGGVFTTFGKSGEGPADTGRGEAPVGLIEKAKARREALLKGAGRA